MHPHNYRHVYFNNIATENIHTEFKTTKGPVGCPVRSHSENNNHIDPSDFLIAGQTFSLGGAGFAYLSWVPMWELAEKYGGSFDTLDCPVCPKMSS